MFGFGKKKSKEWDKDADVTMQDGKGVVRGRVYRCKDTGFYKAVMLFSVDELRAVLSGTGGEGFALPEGCDPNTVRMEVHLDGSFHNQKSGIEAYVRALNGEHAIDFTCASCIQTSMESK